MSGVEPIIIASLIGGGAAVGASAISSRSARSSGPSAPPPLPKAPQPAKAAEQGQARARRSLASRSKTVYTNPLGLGGQADVARKTLLGQ
jgi:hypothetical protein